MKRTAAAGGDFIEQGQRTFGAEYRLAAATEGRTHVRALALLQEHNDDQEETDNNMNAGQYGCNHGLKNAYAASRSRHCSTAD